MKINSELGFRPVPFSELTDDMEFWKGCQGCRNYDILERNNYKMCLCTGLLYDPAYKGKKSSSPLLFYVGKALIGAPLNKINSLISFKKF